MKIFFIFRCELQSLTKKLLNFQKRLINVKLSSLKNSLIFREMDKNGEMQ